jgi:hypothetical protein
MRKDTVSLSSIVLVEVELAPAATAPPLIQGLKYATFKFSKHIFKDFVSNENVGKKFLLPVCDL